MAISKKDKKVAPVKKAAAKKVVAPKSTGRARKNLEVELDLQDPAQAKLMSDVSAAIDTANAVADRVGVNGSAGDAVERAEQSTSWVNHTYGKNSVGITIEETFGSENTGGCATIVEQTNLYRVDVIATVTSINSDGDNHREEKYEEERNVFVSAVSLAVVNHQINHILEIVRNSFGNPAAVTTHVSSITSLTDAKRKAFIVNM